ncbi:MAG: SDR family NAD(P)-dependent oxidoreductase [Bacteroidota bacterium]
MQKKVVLITGCSSGIGKALAVEFLKNNFNVIATARNKDAILELEEKGCQTEQLNVTNDTEQSQVIENTIKIFGRIDILINNAGYGLMAPAINLSEEKIHHQFQTNVYAPISLVQKVAPSMKENGSGIIVNIGSVSGLVTTPFSGAYCASKAALHSFSDALRLELKSFGIDVMTVKAGAIKSNFGNRARKGASEIFGDDSLYKSLESYIMKRAYGSQVVATPAEELAKKIVKIISNGKIPPSYRIGKKSLLLPLLKNLLPTKLFDAILRKKFGLNSLN